MRLTVMEGVSGNGPQARKSSFFIPSTSPTVSFAQTTVPGQKS